MLISTATNEVGHGDQGRSVVASNSSYLANIAAFLAIQYVLPPDTHEVYLTGNTYIYELI